MHVVVHEYSWRIDVKIHLKLLSLLVTEHHHHFTNEVGFKRKLIINEMSKSIHDFWSKLDSLFQFLSIWLKLLRSPSNFWNCGDCFNFKLFELLSKGVDLPIINSEVEMKDFSVKWICLWKVLNGVYCTLMSESITWRHCSVAYEERVFIRLVNCYWNDSIHYIVNRNKVSNICAFSRSLVQHSKSKHKNKSTQSC